MENDEIRDDDVVCEDEDDSGSERNGVCYVNMGFVEYDIENYGVRDNDVDYDSGSERKGSCDGSADLVVFDIVNVMISDVVNDDDDTIDSGSERNGDCDGSDDLVVFDIENVMISDVVNDDVDTIDSGSERKGDCDGSDNLVVFENIMIGDVVKADDSGNERKENCDSNVGLVVFDTENAMISDVVNDDDRGSERNEACDDSADLVVADIENVMTSDVNDDDRGSERNEVCDDSADLVVVDIENIMTSDVNDDDRGGERNGSCDDSVGFVVSDTEKDVISGMSEYVVCHNDSDHVFISFDESLFGAPISDFEFGEDDSIVCDSDFNNVNIEKEKIETFSFLHWNVEGLLSKLTDQVFLSYVCSFHFVCLVETFLQYFSSDVFVGYTVYCKPAVKLSHRGRPSGGVICLIKNEIVPFVRQIEVRSGNFLLFSIDKQLFKTEKDILYVCAYVPPQGSNYYNSLDVDIDGIGMLENCLVDYALTHTDFFTIISGDLNSRTSDHSQCISVDVGVSSLNESCPPNVGRKSQDKAKNSFGKSLIDMCTALNLCILNGMCHGDREGHFTYLCDSGYSVNDYFLMSTELYASLCNYCYLNVIERIDSHHLPVVFSVSVSVVNVVIDENVGENASFEKFTWNSDKANIFDEKMNSEEARIRLANAVQMIDTDINLALNLFNECLKDMADCMKTSVSMKAKRRFQNWFDFECKENKKSVQKLLRRFHRTLSSDDRVTYCKARREYKNLLLRKKKMYNESVLHKLVSSIHDQQTFWESMRCVMPKRKYIKNEISMDQWFEYFNKLLNKDVVIDDANDESIGNEEIENLTLNRPISAEEILLAVRRIKSKKAAGLDGIIGELLKYSKEKTIPFFVTFFNAIFDKGIFPEQWTESIILPLYKKGDVNDPGNYRGISLCNTGSKIYSAIINRRLQVWVEENNITGEHQAGFKKGYSTVDHLFTLLSCIQKQFNSNRNRKLYVAFVDFEKAFDSINRNLLWPILMKNGIRGKLFRGIKSMYENVKAKVRCGAKLTQFINCSAGVKQGDVSSPVIFSLFINELALEIIENGKHGLTFFMDNLELFVLLLADDIILLSETVVGLQNQLRNLHKTSTLLGLKVNLDKSNIIVFRKGGYLSARERWIYDGNVLPVVNVYKYLGIYFSTRLSFAMACRDLASRAKRALLCIMQKLNAVNSCNVKLFLRIFDAQILPIAQYGSEIWGLEKAAEYCEKIHLFALKKFLGVGLHTPNDLVYSEMNRYPLRINFAVNCIRYWLKLIQMDAYRLPKKAYLMLYKLDERGKCTWVSKIRLCLCEQGFGFVWYNQGVGDVRSFLHKFKQRLIDSRWQNWNEHMLNSARFEMYNIFATSIHCLPQYMSMDLNRQLRFIMTKFRLGISDLKVHLFRYKYHNENDLICSLCKEDKEDELHFVLCCPFLEYIRKDFIAKKYYRNPSSFHLSILLSSRHTETIRKLSIYLYKAFKAREIVIS